MKITNFQHSVHLVSFILILVIASFFSVCTSLTGNSISEEEVSFTNPADGAVLAGTFSKPDVDGDFPTVILISGNGQQDRDESIHGHKPFKILAEHLNKNGIAILRFDDRGFGESTGDVWNATIDVLATDALAGVNYLKSRKDVDPGRIGILGHSLGALQGAMLASEQPEIAFLIMLAGPGVSWAENHVAAIAENLTRRGESEEVIESGTRLLEKMFPVMQAGGGYLATKEKLSLVISKWKQSLTGMAKEQMKEFDASHPRYFRTMAEDYASPLYMSLANFESAEYLKNVSCPVLSLIGDKDVRVLSSLNNPAMEDALLLGGNENATVLELRDINHLFQRCETGLSAEYAELEAPFDEEILELITNWILERPSVKR